MAHYEDKFYDVDPGKGKKKDICPYSFFKDGHDVVDFIVPPEGYVFKRFRFEPYEHDTFYEGKIVAEYEVGEIKKTIWERPITWVAIGVVALVFMTLFGYWAAPKIKKRLKRKPPVIDLTVKDTTAIDTTSTDTTTFIPDSTIVEETVENPVTVVEQPETPKEKPQEKPQVKPQETPQEKPQEKPQELPQGETLEVFQESFWTMVHQQSATMDDFYNLFVKYKKKVNCEEYEYLRLVILKNYSTFKEWNKQLLRIPSDELQSIHDISTLKEKIKI